MLSTEQANCTDEVPRRKGSAAIVCLKPNCQSVPVSAVDVEHTRKRVGARAAVDMDDVYRSLARLTDSDLQLAGLVEGYQGARSLQGIR